MGNRQINPRMLKTITLVAAIATGTLSVASGHETHSAANLNKPEINDLMTRALEAADGLEVIMSRVAMPPISHCPNIGTRKKNSPIYWKVVSPFCLRAKAMLNSRKAIQVLCRSSIFTQLVPAQTELPFWYSACMKRDSPVASLWRNRSELKMVGVAGFEPTTPRPPGVCATGLRHTPTCP